MNEHERVQDLAVEYALDILDPAEYRDVEQHLAGCETCRAVYPEMQAVGGALALSVPPVAASPELRARILAGVIGQPQPAVSRRQWGGCTWLLSIVHHRSIDVIRRRKSTTVETFDIVRHDIPAGEAWGDVYAQLTQVQVREALYCLPEEQRQAIELSYFSGLSQQEIAQRLNTPLGTVKGRTRLAMQKLKGLLDDLRPTG
jgi:RNA polymerase sigma factor (sigma-70 family)